MRILRHILLLSLLVGAYLQTLAQSGVSLYHLNNATFQGSYFNPAFFPEGKVFLGLPALSGIALDVNMPASYNDLTLKQGDSTVWDLQGFADDTKFRNFISIESEINTFHLGFRPSKSIGVSLSIRERIAARLYYSPDLIKVLARGRDQYLEGTINLNPSLIDARYYREYGLGIWKSLPGKGINVGARIKYINGMFAAVSDRNFDGSVSVDQNYIHDFRLRGAGFNTSGFDIEGSELSSHLINNGNVGVGLDLGAHWRINEFLSAAVSVNDLGFIRWKENPKQNFIPDTSFVFQGLGDLDDIQDFGRAFEDSLVQRFPDSTRRKPFTTGLNTTTWGSLLYQLTPNDLITGSVSSHIVRNQFRMIYAIGYTRKVTDNFKVSGNVSRIPQQGIDVGLGLMANAGPVQFYLAGDKLVKVWNVPELSGLNVRFGVNLVFGRRKEVKDDRSDLVHPSPYGKKAKIEKSDGIYWIVKRKHPRPVYQPHLNNEKKKVEKGPYIKSDSGKKKKVEKGPIIKSGTTGNSDSGKGKKSGGSRRKFLNIF